MKNAIPYYRVSTGRQKKSGLGLEAQEKAIHDYAERMGLRIIQEFTETESGKNSKRPILLKALQACKKNKATLIIAKLDRLSRNVAFISSLMESKVDFVVVDNPEADDFVLHILASVAQKEARDISTRTKLALQAAKRRGIVLGKYGSEVLSKLNMQAAKDFAIKMYPVIENLKTEGYKTIRSLTNELNNRNVPTYTKTSAVWHVRTVHNLIKRIEGLDIQLKNTQI